MGSLVELARKLRPKIVELAQALADDEALIYRELYDPWAPGIKYENKDGKPFKVRRGDRLFKLITPHTSQNGWEPENTPALWEGINEINSGTLDNPIPYDGNMALEAGKYYSQGGVVYRCTRDTVTPVYHDLALLVGLYVEVAE